MLPTSSALTLMAFHRLSAVVCVCVTVESWFVFMSDILQVFIGFWTLPFMPALIYLHEGFVHMYVSFNCYD